MNPKNLEQLLAAAGNPVDMLRNSQIGAFVYPVVASEFTNFRDEQLAARKTAMLIDQTHHMVEALVEGKDATKLFTHLAPNSMKSLKPNQAKQFAPCNQYGNIIGDGIMFHFDNKFNLVGRAPLVNWVQFHAETGGYDVVVKRDERSPSNPNGKRVTRRHYRFQVQGPAAMQILEKVNGGPLPKIDFFRIGEINIAGRKVRALHHGMAGAPGLEIWGPYDDADEIRSALVEAGKEFGLVQMGSRAYASIGIESGWIPSPLQAVYSGEAMKPYQKWLPANGFEATCSLGGSFVSSNIEDYYLTPYDLGYGSFIKFDHDFVGREALEEKSKEPHRRKVTFAWNGDDVTKIFASLFNDAELPYKYFDLPIANYSSCSYDAVSIGNRVIGFSMFTGYSHSCRTIISLGVVDPDVKTGDVVTLLWGEENGGTRKPTVERHRQLEVRVRVSEVPFVKDVREQYAHGWRARQA